MVRKILPGVLIALLVSLGVASRSDAASIEVLYDSLGFESFNLGALNGQTGGLGRPWVVDNANTPGGAYQVQDSVSVSGKAVRVTSANGTDWAYPESFNPAFVPGVGQTLVIEADIARTLTTAVGGTSSFAYAIDVYDPNITRITRFGLVATSGSIRPFVTALASGTSTTASNFLVGGSINPNQFVSFRGELDFATKTLNLFINGTSVTGASSLFFASLAPTSFSDADFQVSTNAAANDVGYLDNYKITAVPEPSTYAMAAIAMGMSGWHVWRKRRKGDARSPQSGAGKRGAIAEGCDGT